MKRLILLILALFIVFRAEEEVREPKPFKFPNADFRTSYSILRKYEGNYGNMQHDRGGETYAGIVKKWNKDWYGWKYVDQKKRKHNEFVPQAEFWVQDFYLNWWIDEGFDQINNQRTANYIFEFRVLSSRSSVTIIQKSLVNLGQKIDIDGYMGQETIDAINSVNQRLLINGVKARRMKLYRDIVREDDTQKKWINGWMKRAKNV